MFAKGLSFILAIFFVIRVDALDDVLNSLDDAMGRDYVALDDVEEVRRIMSERGYGYGEDWIVMPDGNGSPQIAILNPSFGGDNSRIINGESTKYENVEDAVHLTLFTKSNPEKGDSLLARNVTVPSFDASKPTKILIHGWQSSGDSSTITDLRDAYLKKSDVNVIAVDWSGPAKNIFYPASAAYTRNVGQYIAELIDNLAETKGAKYGDIHIIGHSLGAHVAGVAGHNTKSKVARITGLDPALPCFENAAEPPYMLDKSDADFVQGIHTCAGALGMSARLGHVDFYPNGGTPLQPGCCCLSEIISACSHGRSHRYFAESIVSEKAFISINCPTWRTFKNNSCDGDMVPMGEYTPTTARGTFYLQTNAEAPFGLGLDGITFTP